MGRESSGREKDREKNPKVIRSFSLSASFHLPPIGACSRGVSPLTVI